MSKVEFKKMNNGNIVVVCCVNTKNGVVHGWNLASKNLRIKNYKFKMFENGWMENISEVVLALQELPFYNLEDCKYHNASVTQRRRDKVISCLADW